MAFLAPLPLLAQATIPHASLRSRALGAQRPRVAKTARRPPRAMADSPPPPPGGSGSGSGPGSGSGSGSGPPDGLTLTQALELSFRTVWIRLFTDGVGQKYTDAIVGFVVAATAAYKAGYTIPALKFELAANERTDNVNGTSIGLTDQEKETRLVWITLVYLTLRGCNFPCERDVPPVADQVAGSPLEKLVPGLSALVDAIREAERKGFTLETFKMELNVQSQTAERDSSAGADVAAGDQAKKPDSLSGAGASIRSQWSRIVFSTLGILPNELKGLRR